MTRVPAAAPAAPADIRRRVRRMRIAAVGRVDPSSVYCVLLAIGMAVALVWKPLVGVVWPTGTGRPSVLAPVGAALVLLAFFGVLRQLGPVVVSRGDATWLLPAPVPRRTLLTPALLLTAVAATAVGGMVGLALAGRVTEGTATASAILAGLAGGVVAALLVALLAMHGQRHPRTGGILDLVAAGIGAALVAAAAGVQLADGYALPVGPPAASIGLSLAGVALALAVAAVGWAWWRLDGWPTHRVVEASATTGSYADAVHAVEPSFLSEQSARRYWRGRTGIRASRLLRGRRVPPLVAQDLLHVRRKPGRLAWLVGTALAPTVLADGPTWLLIAVLLIGVLAAASLTGESTHADASNPAVLRLLGLTTLQVRAQRLVVPTGIAVLWLLLALGVLQAAGGLAGPWWALGVAAGPSAAVAALYRAKMSAASIGSVFVDTPLGGFPSGMLLWLANGVDVVAVLTLPVSIGLATVHAPEALGWNWVLAQAAASAAGCLLLLRRSAAATVGA
ncbi:DUF6297 family protein [Micromonospora sp. NPDC094482]|uniref:DUF6297 family protein n=1 Tax=unclassified Micromonospora TaxID=2617518 RepID=UPI003327D1CB